MYLNKLIIVLLVYTIEIIVTVQCGNKVIIIVVVVVVIVVVSK